MANVNTKLPFVLAGVAATMLAAAFASKPLYDTFCRVTGFAGTTQRAEAASGDVLDRAMTVRFDANVTRGLTLEFDADQISQTGPVGATQTAFYRATNTGARTITITSTFNVTPFKVGPYFRKLECFCFTEHTLAPGETIDMPVIYFVDPKIDDDARLDDVSTITLSYTFFEAEGEPPRDVAAAPSASGGEG